MPVAGSIPDTSADGALRGDGEVAAESEHGERMTG
jgi:hypothetical protein